MLKFFAAFLFILISLIFTNTSLAAGSNFVTVVNPVRGSDFWEEKGQDPTLAVLGQKQILQDFKVPATWLIRFDALSDSKIINSIKDSSDEKGLFLEVTPSWTSKAGVDYRESAVWHLAGSVFLTGYETPEREKLIDSAFSKFKETFGVYPKSVGSWYLDSYSLNYMEEKYGVDAALIVADQYSTDNYQVWGQYFGAPFYPYKKNTLMPAQNPENKIPVVVTQWAARDPINGYGEGVNETTYSVQPNDYIDFHELDSAYFNKLLDIYLGQDLNQFNQVVVGLENSYSWEKYKDEYKKQIEILNKKRSNEQLNLVTMASFAKWYKEKFPAISPEHIIVADDPLGHGQKVVWFMNSYFRAGWFLNNDGSVFRDVRQYVEGIEEPCFKGSCQQINFATFSTRVLDDVTYKHKLVLDEGKITDFKVQKIGKNYAINYKNEAGKEKVIEFLPRDISIDGKVSSIDGFILEAQSLQAKEKIRVSAENKVSVFGESVLGLLFKSVKFVLFLAIALFIPGYLLVSHLKQKSLPLNIFLSLSSGIVLLTLLSFIFGYLKLPEASYVYITAALVIFVIKKYYHRLDFSQALLLKENIPLILLIILGTFFQSLIVARSGFIYDFGVGFWGPTGHDGIWHQALIAQLVSQVPPQNPGFSGTALSNYHYFYDLLVAKTYILSQVPVTDLLYRFYPILFSVLLGFGTYLFLKNILNSKIAILISLYFVYFGGSFGWIVDVIKRKEIGGESAFWVNQPVSMNLNPPFAISLILLISALLIFMHLIKTRNLIASLLLILVAGTLVEFKVYAGIILLGGLFIIAFQQAALTKSLYLFKTLLGSLALSILLFFPQLKSASGLLVFSPFWFIHTMIDFSDRVGWERLTLGREAYIQRKDWFKFLLAEGLGLLLFIVGNLGTRFLALFLVFNFFKKKLWQSLELSLVFWMGIISLGIPILFIQKGNSWNSIQFFYYTLYFVSLFTGFVLVSLWKKLPRFLGLPIIALILILTPISSLTSFRSGFYQKPPTVLTAGELEALSFLQKQPLGVVLTYPFDKDLRGRLEDPYPLFAYETTSYVSAYSFKPSYLEDEIQQEILQNDFKKRLVASKNFFSGKDTLWSKKFLKDYNINYIYLPKIYQTSLNTSELNLKQIYGNKEVDIYQVLN